MEQESPSNHMKKLCSRRTDVGMSCFSRRIDCCIIKSQGVLQGSIVRNSVHKFGSLTVLSDSSAARRYLFRSLILSLFLSFVGGNASANTDVQKAPVTSVGPGLSFAIADFDGDLRPDIASVQTGRSGFSGTDYWIQLQLTTAGRQSFHVVASIGGLQIAARDVNGDHAVD